MKKKELQYLVQVHHTGNDHFRLCFQGSQLGTNYRKTKLRAAERKYTVQNGKLVLSFLRIDYILDIKSLRVVTHLKDRLDN